MSYPSKSFVGICPRCKKTLVKFPGGAVTSRCTGCQSWVKPPKDPAQRVKLKQFKLPVF